jgi:hypothetical protein
MRYDALKAPDPEDWLGSAATRQQTEVNAAVSGAVNFGILPSGAGNRPSAQTA